MSFSGSLIQNAIYIAQEPPEWPISADDWERAAKAKLDPGAFGYIAGGAGAESTVRANLDAFERWRIRPRMLTGNAVRDISVEVFGLRSPAPFFLAPVGVLSIAHEEAELGVAKASASSGVPLVLSSAATHSIEEVAETNAPRWFQLYWSTDEGLVDSFLARARAAGAEAVVVTLDTTMLGWRTMDLNLGYLPFARGRGIAQYTADGRFRQIVRERLAAADGGTGGDVKVSLGAIKTLISISRSFPGSFLENLRSPEPRAAVATFLDIYSRPSLTWRDIETLRDRTDLPILLKGIQHPDDARRAVEAGVDGIVVSNHGGRQVDGAIGSLDALADIAPVVDGKARLLLDSGVRGGSDVFKAIALGADAVLIARPYLYGLALAGWEGARDVVANIIAEFDLTMGLSGLTSVAEIGRDALRQI